MKRSELLGSAAGFGLIAMASPSQTAAASAGAHAQISPLVPPNDGVPVAFLLSDMAVMIDFAGPWEVFQDAHVVGRSQPAFNLYTVAETTKPITVSGGAKIEPAFSLGDAPAPKVIVVPAQSNPTPAVKDWLVKMAGQADLVMSVCTGAFVLAQAGLLDGRAMTTHHSAFTMIAMNYPNVTVVRGTRFVDDGGIATSAGLSAGIDLALHVVARYYGVEAAKLTAYDMEYQSGSWLDAGNAAYRTPPVARAGDAICPVCWMEIARASSLTLSYRGVKYYFCMPAHEQVFASAPQRFLSA